MACHLPCLRNRQPVSQDPPLSLQHCFWLSPLPSPHHCFSVGCPPPQAMSSVVEPPQRRNKRSLPELHRFCPQPGVVRELFPTFIDDVDGGSTVPVVVGSALRRTRIGRFCHNIDDPWPVVPPSDVGACDVVCEHCHALRWNGETKGMCCRSGAVQLPPLLEPPAALWLLLTDTTSSAKKFRINIRKYNAALMMASSTAKVQHNFGGGPGAFRINGTVHHRIGALIPSPGIAP